MIISVIFTHMPGSGISQLLERSFDKFTARP
jgi:hypothetical protein